MKTRLFMVAGVALSITIGGYVAPAAAARICKNDVCAEIFHVADVSKPTIRARVFLTATRPTTHYNVRIEGGPQIEVRCRLAGWGCDLWLHRGQRNFSVQACAKEAPVIEASDCTAWANFSDELASPPPPPPKVGENTNLPGSDYRSFETTKAGSAECQVACSHDEGKCKAWTWSRPGVQAPKGKCWLKDAVPTAVADNCCVSGLWSKVKTLGAPKPLKVLGKRTLLRAKDDTDVFSGPSGLGEYERTGMMEVGTTAALLQKHQDGWCKLRGVADDGGDGWVAEDHLLDKNNRDVSCRP